MPDGFNHFPQISGQLYTACSQVVSKTAFDCQGNIQGFIRANGQVDTGFMLNSVHVEDGANDLNKFVVVGASYGVYQNYGTRYLPARPFFEPGVEQTRPGFESAINAIESRLS